MIDKLYSLSYLCHLRLDRFTLLFFISDIPKFNTQLIVVICNSKYYLLLIHFHIIEEHLETFILQRISKMAKKS